MLANPLKNTKKFKNILGFRLISCHSESYLRCSVNYESGLFTNLSSPNLTSLFFFDSNGGIRLYFNSLKPLPVPSNGKCMFNLLDYATVVKSGDITKEIIFKTDVIQGVIPVGWNCTNPLMMQCTGKDDLNLDKTEYYFSSYDNKSMIQCIGQFTYSVIRDFSQVSIRNTTIMAGAGEVNVPLTVTLTKPSPLPIQFNIEPYNKESSAYSATKFPYAVTIPENMDSFQTHIRISTDQWLDNDKILWFNLVHDPVSRGHYALKKNPDNNKSIKP